MITLFDLTYRVAALLGAVIEGTATGGSTTTTIDTARIEADDSWNGGTLWVVSAGGTAPEGEYAVISDFVSTTHTITHTALTAAIAAGDSYAISKKRFPLWLLKQKINAVVRKHRITQIDTSLTSADSQTEYSLPSGIIDVREVWLQNKIDSDDNRWEKLYDWRVQAVSGGYVLVLPQLDSGYTIKTVYTKEHENLVTADDILDDSIPPERVLYEAAKECLVWRKQRGDPSVNQLINYFSDLADNAAQTFPMKTPHRTSRLLIVR